MAKNRNGRTWFIGFALCCMLLIAQTGQAFNLNDFLDQANDALDKFSGTVQKTFGGPVATPPIVAPNQDPASAQAPAQTSRTSAQAASGGSWWDRVFGGIENSTEKTMGAQGHEALKKNPGFYNSAADLNRVGAIARRLVPVVERKDLTYRFTILNSDEVNAFALPGGYVYVTKGLLKAVKNDDELAAVMAHELGHINKKHGIRQAEKAGLLTAVVLAMGLKDETQKYQKYAAVAAFFANMKFSRDDEYEADRCAVQYTSKAGYNPYGMSAFLQTINKDNGLTKVTKYFSTHPPTTDRIKRANEEAQKVSGRAPPANTSAQTTQSTQSTTVSSTSTGSGSSGSTTRPTTPPAVPQGITLQEAYQDYLYTKSIYEQKVSQGAPYNEIMAAFNDYQRAKEIYFQLKNRASQR